MRHAIEVLFSFSAEEPVLGVSEIARRIGLHKSSVHRLLATLEEARLVERDRATNRFRLGVKLVSLAAPLLSNLRLVEVARPYLEDLAQRSGETISLSIWDGDGAVSIEQALGGNAVKHYAPPGRHNPAHCTASGKVLLAHSPQADIDRVISDTLDGFTERTVLDRDLLQAELAEIRRRGYAMNEGEFVADVGAVAAIVRNISGAVVAAITATVPMYRFGPQRRRELIRLVSQTAESLSKRMGHAEPRERLPD